MLFNSFVFLGLFLPATYLVFWQLRTAQPRYAWLTLTGYVFYGYWNPKFCLLMAFSTLISYAAGLGLGSTTDARRRKIYLIIPITVDLLLLGFFKYTNFLLQSLSDLLGSAGHSIGLPHLDILLPIGISFYTFHTISYIIDCYRGVVRPTRNLLEFAAYVSLFSQLVAGPIVRFRQLEQDLENLGQASRTRWLSTGVTYFILGLVEKVLLADSLAFFVDQGLSSYQVLSTTGAWLAMLGYSLQLYFDFAGYSDMAIGLGYLFGLRIPINFNSPYKALDPSDFWQRWHISLSSCLRDYLYIPLGGSRSGNRQTNRNLLITMLIGGLWHGASWTFVIWGAYHGLLLVVHRRFKELWERIPQAARRLTMFGLVTIGWVLFRATDLAMASHLLKTMLIPTHGALIPGTARLLPVLAIAALLALAAPNTTDLQLAERPPQHLRRLALTAAFGACVAVMLGSGSSPFLYFQF